MNDIPGTITPSGDEPSRRAATWSLTHLLIAQRRAWQRGQRVPVEAYLERHPALADDTDAVLDLIGNELLVRQEQGETPELAEYLARFPQWAAEIRIQFEVEQAIASDTLAQ